MRIPRIILQAFKTLGYFTDITEGSNDTLIEKKDIPQLSVIRSHYAQLVKEAHPDTAPLHQSNASAKVTILADSFDNIKKWYIERME